jgi:hypothetical protein
MVDSEQHICRIRNAFEQLLNVTDDQHLRLCYLSFESNLSMKRLVDFSRIVYYCMVFHFFFANYSM